MSRVAFTNTLMFGFLIFSLNVLATVEENNVKPKFTETIGTIFNQIDQLLEEKVKPAAMNVIQNLKDDIDIVLKPSPDDRLYDNNNIHPTNNLDLIGTLFNRKGEVLDDDALSITKTGNTREEMKNVPRNDERQPNGIDSKSNKTELDHFIVKFLNEVMDTLKIKGLLTDSGKIIHKFGTDLGVIPTGEKPIPQGWGGTVIKAKNAVQSCVFPVVKLIADDPNATFQTLMNAFQTAKSTETQPQMIMATALSLFVWDLLMKRDGSDPVAMFKSGLEDIGAVIRCVRSANSFGGVFTKIGNDFVEGWNSLR